MALDPDLRNWILLILGNTPVYLVLGRVFFGDWDGFVESLKFWLMPDIFSLFRGQYWADNWAEFKLCIFLGLCWGAVVLEHRFFFPST